MCSSFRVQNITLFQGLSCLWQHNDARIIIALVWFYNLFLWNFCHFRGNRFKQTVLKYYAIDSPRANPYFLSLIYWGLTCFRRSYLNSQFILFFRNNYPNWKTLAAEIYNFLFSFFLIWEYVGRNGKIFPLFREKISIFLCFSSIEAWIYTQFKCLNGIGDLSWSFMIVQQAHV